MKTLVRIFSVFLAIFCIALTLSACKDKENENANNGPEYADYTVNVTDAIGKPISNVIIHFTGADNNTTKKVTGKDGTAVLKNALVGEYDVFVEAGPSGAVVVDSKFKMTADKKSLHVVVLDPERAMKISGVVDDDTYAYVVATSEYNVVGKPGAMSYYVFNASIKGVYKFSFSSSDTDMTVGYYGNPIFVQGQHIGDGEYDGKSFEIVVQDVDTPYVIGLNFANSSEAVLKIERVGDAPFDPQFVTATQIPAKEKFKHYRTGDLSALTKADGTSLAITAINVEDPLIGFNGTYSVNDGGNTVNIVVTDDKITIGTDVYSYIIRNGVPVLVDKSGETIEDYTFSVEGSYTDLDITDSSLEVTLGDDGYYYTSDGKLVYIHISSSSRYYEPSIALISGCIDNNVGNSFGGIVYDEGGNFVSKNGYNEMIESYYQYSDASGLYPLTAELVEAIKLHAENVGWWNSSSPNFLFAGVDYDPDNLWLFLCCTAD